MFKFATLIFKPITLLTTLALLTGCGQKYFYYPDQTDYGHTPTRLNQPFDNLTINSHDGTKLNAWFVPSTQHKDSKEAYGTVIVLHGNAANLTNQYAAVEWLPAQGFNVFIFDYRGFGLSEGKPNFKGVFEDSDSAINFIRSYPKVDSEKLVVLAESLGGNNAISAIGKGNRQGIKAIVVDSTFYSYSSIANKFMWGSGLLVNNTYSASRYIADIAPMPLLLIHGTKDSIIPYQHSQWLFDKANQPKQFILAPNAEHITALFDPIYQDKIVEFFKGSLKDKK